MVDTGGVLVDDVVTTDALASNSATLITSLYYNAGGAGLSATGSYVNLPSGPAVVSIATGTKATQQCFIKALVGTRRAGGSNDFITYRCKRNDGTILAQTYTVEATNDQDIIPLSFVDPSPSVSVTHTYTIEANSNGLSQIREVAVDGFLGKTG